MPVLCHLITHLRALFAGPVCLKYMDREGDLVTLSSRQDIQARAVAVQVRVRKERVANWQAASHRGTGMGQNVSAGWHA